MTDRDKLIALYKEWWEAPFDDEEECENCTKDIPNCNECLYGKFADYLFSQGVVVRDKGEWALEHGSYGAIICPICKHEALLEQSRISTNLLYVESNFCPNCGADMRGEQHE